MQVLQLRRGLSAENFPGGSQQKKTRPKNSTIKPPSTLSVSCMNIQGSHAPSCPPLPTPVVTMYKFFIVLINITK